MRARVVDSEGALALIIGRKGVKDCQALTGLTEHDLRDIEFVLAQRRAMSKRCTTTRGEHTCALYLGHVEAHLCRSCTESWSGHTVS